VKKRIALCLLALTGAAFGQATFEPQTPTCGPVFPTPCGTLGDPEGISWNGVLSGTGALPSPIAACVDSNPNLVGFPTGGLQYGRVHGGGTVTSPANGGPAPESALSNQIYIPIPPGATTVSFMWDFYNADSLGSASWNDGMSVDVLAVCGGTSIGNLVYADSFTPVSGIAVDLACTSGVAGAGNGDVAPFGAPNPFGPAPIPAGGTLLRVQVWNGGDNGFTSRGVIDDVVFSVGPVPCALQFSSPAGPGSLDMVNSACPAAAGLDYQIGLTLAAGAFPSGWFYGVDISLAELINQHGPAFQNILWGTLDGTGASFFGTVPAGGLPSGLQIWAVTSHWAPGFSAGAGARAAVTYTIP
jgi:hypothetical protein